MVTFPNVNIDEATLLFEGPGGNKGRQVLEQLAPLRTTKSVDDGSDGLKPPTIAQLLPLAGSPVALGASAPANGLDKHAVEAGPGFAYELAGFHGFDEVSNYNRLIIIGWLQSDRQFRS